MTGGSTPLDRFLLHPDDATRAALHAVATVLAGAARHYGVPVGLTIAVALIARAMLRRHQARELARGGRFVEIFVPPEADLAGARTLWSNLVGILHPTWRRWLEGQCHVTFEYAWSCEGVRIGLWVPRRLPPGMVEHAVEAAWPGCRTRCVEPPPDPLPAHGRATGGVLRLAEPEWFPLRTDHDADPLRSLLGAAGGLDAGQTIAVQIAARPLAGRRLSRGRRAATAMRRGLPVTRVGRLLDLALPGPGHQGRPSADPSVAPDIRAILDKASGPAYEVVVRYGLATDDATRSGRQWLRGHAHAVASASEVYTERNRLRRHHLRRIARILASRRMKNGDLLSVPELAALAHLPLDATVPGLVRAGAKVVAAPPCVPSQGRVLGDTQKGVRRAVAVSVEDARHHLHLIGKTGVGKSTLLLNLVLDDASAGRGAVVIDPAGDLVNDILDRLPAEAASRVVLFDPDDAGAPPCMNVLDGDDRELAVDNLVGVFRRLFEAYWGPRTDDVLRAACLTLLHREGATLALVPRLLTEPEFRRGYVAAIHDPAGLSGFWTWYESMTPALQSQVIGPVLNKLRAFLLRDFCRAVVGRARSSFDMAAVLDGGLCLVRLPKAMGEDASRLLGSFVIAQVWQAATARARIAPPDRRPAALYVDECHNYLNLPRALDEMLAEARKFNLSLVLSHQNIAQLPPRLRDGVSANARNKAFFAMSPEDAHELRRHVEPAVTEHDLANLGAFQTALRVVVDGAESSAFTAATRPAPPAITGRAAAIRAESQRRFGRRVEPADAPTPEEIDALAGTRHRAARESEAA